MKSTMFVLNRCSTCRLFCRSVDLEDVSYEFSFV